MSEVAETLEDHCLVLEPLADRLHTEFVKEDGISVPKEAILVLVSNHISFYLMC